MRPSFKPRTPYILHYDDQTVVLGDPEYLQTVETYLVSADLTVRSTFWDQTDAAGDEQAFFEPDPEPENLNSVGIIGDETVFWNAIESAVFQQTEWPQEDEATVYPPRFPEWLTNAQSWLFDPVAPALGPASHGGWVRRRAVGGKGFPMGLFQLTDPESFWVFGAEGDLEDLQRLCQELARFRLGFDQATAFLDESDSLASMVLPLQCRDALQEELLLRGVDVETLFWA